MIHWRCFVVRTAEQIFEAFGHSLWTAALSLVIVAISCIGYVRAERSVGGDSISAIADLPATGSIFLVAAGAAGMPLPAPAGRPPDLHVRYQIAAETDDKPPPPANENIKTEPNEAEGGGGPMLRFSEPVPFGAYPVNGQSIEKLAAGVPLFPPIEGLDEKLWKRNCSTCHKWERQNLCTQGMTYVKNPAFVFRNQHPYGGPFKLALMEWAKTGCK